MSDDMFDQLAAYGRFHRQHQESVTIVEVAEHSTRRPPVTDRLSRNEPGAPEARFARPRSGASERSSTRRRGLVTAVAAAAVAAVAFAGVTLLDSGGEDVGRVTAGRGADAPGTVLPLAPMWASDLGIDAPRGVGGLLLDLPEGANAAHASIGAVAVGGPGLVAVGSDENDAAVWTSADGQTWSRVPDDEAVFGGPGFQGMWDVVVGGPGFVAVGADTSSRRAARLVEPVKHAVAAVWTSPDGISWSRVAHDRAVFGRATGEANELFRMTAVTTGGPGLVAIGGRGGGPDQVEGDAIADRAGGAVWTSIDGITWSRVPHDPAVFDVGAQMRDITPGGPGLVVVGDRAVWTSPDGLRWTLAANVIEAQFVLAVTEGGPGLVAVGAADGDCCNPVTLNAAVWTSFDGTTWSRVPSQADVLGGPGLQAMQSVAAGGPGLVATGLGGGSGRLTVWTSVDGITWSRASDPALPDTTSSIETLLRLYGFDGSRPGALPDGLEGLPPGST